MVIYYVHSCLLMSCDGKMFADLQHLLAGLPPVTVVLQFSQDLLIVMVVLQLSQDVLVVILGLQFFRDAPVVMMVLQLSQNVLVVMVVVQLSPLRRL